MRVTRSAAAAAAGTLIALTGTAACGLGGGGETSVADQRSLRIGVKQDQPGLGLRGPDGAYRGFDVDVATYVAGRLGVPPSRITFMTTPSSIREKALADGTVDMIFASYSITAKRKTQVTFGGPYYVPHQDTMVRAADASIGAVRDLKGKRICEVTGSNSWRRVIEERKVAAEPVRAETYGQCMDLLSAGRLDAVSTDDLILAGFATSATKIINAPFTDEKYGVGLRKNDLKGCEAVNRALTEMYQDGKARQLLAKWFGKSGLKLTTSVPQFEGCSYTPPAKAVHD
ncbi:MULTISPECIES: glutamate ABC transporter substrate-binding protein [Thermomonosporaceae]|uniref:glutamate ABC transporter substrate-binding protein n=1 Tax=Thermomonosporaceae TaxID=2012 RepID=UPI00255AADCD|nr:MULTISPECIES: glutamate ABC transporter substrate-binding protein [Thermomonosporaceae]MDL4773676.1 glutamate ABC transporter substrate-binding protein [Actinomadura xylanilytica]